MMSIKLKGGLLLVVLAFSMISFFQPEAPQTIALKDHAQIALIGGNLGSRMINYDHFETELHLRYPKSQLSVRNLCDGGDTLAFDHILPGICLGHFPMRNNFKMNLPINPAAKVTLKPMTNG